LTVASAAVLSLVLVGPTLAVTARTKQNVGTAGPLTQTHTLFFNTTPCAAGEVIRTGYAIQSWNTRFQRTAGADREVAKVHYDTGEFGFSCATGNIDNHENTSTFYPRFGSTNDFTYTLQLHWPMVWTTFPVGSVGSSVKGYYGYRTGHPGSIAATICTNIDAKIDFNAGNFNSCPDL
jgi:hypothetical protein